jgi:hypothetical protein
MEGSASSSGELCPAVSQLCRLACLPACLPVPGLACTHAARCTPRYPLHAHCHRLLQGQFSPGGGVACSNCTAGYACPAGSSSASPAASMCPAGRYSVAGALQCLPAAQGFFTSAGAATATQTACTTALAAGRWCLAGSSNSSGLPCPPVRRGRCLPWWCRRRCGPTCGRCVRCVSCAGPVQPRWWRGVLQLPGWISVLVARRHELHVRRPMSRWSLQQPRQQSVPRLLRWVQLRRGRQLTHSRQHWWRG